MKRLFAVPWRGGWSFAARRWRSQVFPPLHYASSWLAGGVVIIFVAWMCMDRSCAGGGGYPALKQALQQASGRPACDYVFRYRYGWPWRFAMIESDVAMTVTFSPYHVSIRELRRELREIHWVRLVLLILGTIIVASLASRRVDDARKRADSLLGVVRRLSQFRLRTFALGITAIVLSLGHVVERGAQQHRIVTEIGGMGLGYVFFDCHGASMLGLGCNRPADTLWNRAVGILVGEYGVDDVNGIWFMWSPMSAARIRDYAQLGQVEVIGLGTTPVDAEVVNALRQHKSLWIIRKEGMTAEEETLLRQGLPQCVVVNDPMRDMSSILSDKVWQEMQRSQP